MFALGPAALAGFLIGLRHATDADHVAAVGAIVARERTVRGAALVGAAWGLGHTLTLLVLGGAIVMFGLSVPPRVGLALELAVGLMLIGLGAWNLATRTQRSALTAARDAQLSLARDAAHDVQPSLARDAAHDVQLSLAPDAHDVQPSLARDDGHDVHPSVARDAAHDVHPSLARDAAHDDRCSLPSGEAPSTVRRALRPLVVGSMHGLAGSAAAALLVVATARGTSWGLAYLLVFGIGTMIGMTVLTTALALPLRSALERSRRAESWIRAGSGILSFAIGAFVVIQVGFHDGLFLR